MLKSVIFMALSQTNCSFLIKLNKNEALDYFDM